MDRLQAMQLFVRVAELSSFTAVAQQMGVARSVVTRQIAALEQHLGLQLMARSTRRLALTPAGAVYLEQCRVILNLVEVAETGAAEERQMPRGRLRISLPLSFGLMRLVPVLLDFARAYPEVRLEMDYTDRRVNLIEEGVDLAIRITGRLGPGEIARTMGSLRLLTLASPAYLERHGCPRHPADLVHHDCLVYTAGGSQQGSQSWTYEADGVPQRFPVRSRIQANNGQALVEAVAQGLGIACQPDFIAAPFLQNHRVTEILTNFKTPALGIYAMLPENRQMPHRVRVLLDFLSNHLVLEKS